MATSESPPPEDQHFSRFFNRTSAMTLAVVASLLLGGLVVCGGTVALPIFLQRQRRAEEATRRAQAVENLKQIGNAVQRKNVEQDATARPEATQPGEGSTEPVEPE